MQRALLRVLQNHDQLLTELTSHFAAEEEAMASLAVRLDKAVTTGTITEALSLLTPRRRIDVGRYALLGMQLAAISHELRREDSAERPAPDAEDQP